VCSSDLVNELHALNPNFSVTLFTDGEAVCSRGKDAEEQRTLKIVSEFADKIIAFNTVGYSCYYNQKFLKDLAALSQFGVFTHSSQIAEYSSIFQNNFERISGGKVDRVDIILSDDVVGLYLTRKFIKMGTDDFHLSRLDKNKNQFFLVSTGEFEFEYNGEHFNSKQVKEEAALPTITNFLYAYAQGLYYNNFRKNSLEVLATIGDKALIDSHMSAFTFDEAGEHQKKLEAAALSTSARLLDGKAKANYLPAKDAFCVMDLIGLLANNNAYYMPFHDEAAMDVALQITNWLYHNDRVDGVINLGDFLDLPSQGRFEQEAAFAGTTQKAFDRGHKFLQEQRAAAGPQAEIVLIEGNHDRRMEKFVMINAARAWGLKRANIDELPVMSIPYLLRLDEIGVEYIDAYPAGSYWLTENLRAIHGSKVRSGGSTAAAYTNADPHISTIF
jgi:hypothetical protein